MALQTIFNAIRSFLPKAIGQDVGAEHLGDNAAPPRVVWVPADERFVPIELHSDPLPIRVIAQGEQNIEAHCWGKDFDEADDVKQAVIMAVRLAVGTSAKPVHGTWPQRANAQAQLGREYVLTFAFEIPVPVPPSVAGGQATITNTGPHDVKLPFGNPPPFGE